MFNVVFAFIKSNPKFSKYTTIFLVVLSAYAFNNKVVYNKGFNSGKASVVCPLPPKKSIVCSQEISLLDNCELRLQKTVEQYDKKVSNALDACRSEEVAACEEKIDAGLKICVDFNCELCDDFRSSSND